MPDYPHPLNRHGPVGKQQKANTDIHSDWY